MIEVRRENVMKAQDLTEKGQQPTHCQGGAECLCACGCMAVGGRCNLKPRTLKAVEKMCC